MLTRCQLSSLLSKTASTSAQGISKPPRTRPNSFFQVGSSRRWFTKGTTTSSEKQLSGSPSKIEWSFDSWGGDNVFEDLDGEPLKKDDAPREQTYRPQYLEKMSSNPNVMGSFHPKHAPRQTLSKRERDTLTEMVDSILKPDMAGKDTQDDESPARATSTDMKNLVSRLRQYDKKARLAKRSHEPLDKKLEEIGLCTTDLQLLEWAAKEVFGESETAHSGGIESPLYPKLVAHLMRTFRVQYQDPHLALAIFDHAKNLSTMSFVFGCSTDSYNELLETQWDLSHNLEIIHASVEDMVLNGVPPNAKTRRLVETFRQEVSEGSHDRDMNILIKIEQLIAASRFTKANRYEEWKSGMTNLDETQMFDDWESQRKRERFQSQDIPNGPRTNGRQIRGKEDVFQFQDVPDGGEPEHRAYSRR